MVKVKDPYGRNTSTVYRRKCKELKQSAQGGVCGRCGGEIDRTLPESESNSTEYWTADHEPPLSEGGSLLKGMFPAHRRCNSRHGRQIQMARAAAGNIEFSRDW